MKTIAEYLKENNEKAEQAIRFCCITNDEHVTTKDGSELTISVNYVVPEIKHDRLLELFPELVGLPCITGTAEEIMAQSDIDLDTDLILESDKEFDEYENN